MKARKTSQVPWLALMSLACTQGVLEPRASRAPAASAPQSVGPQPSIDSVPRDSATAPTLADAVTRFGARLGSALAKPERSLAFSPLGIHMALAMLLPGQDAQQREQLAHLLGAPTAIEDLTDGYGRLLAAAQREPGVAISTRFDVQHDTPLPADFERALRTGFAAEVARQDFEKDPAPAMRAINAWFRERTQGRIPSLLEEGNLTRATRLVCSNAVDFRQSWQYPFERGATSPRPFHRADGSQVLVPTMHAARIELESARTDAGLWFALPFAGRERWFMVGLPQAARSVGQLEEELRTIGSAALSARLVPAATELFLPKLDWLTPTLRVDDALESLGMTPERSGQNSWSLQAVYQRVAFVLDEEGAEAAAATSAAAGIPISGVVAPPLRVDRPFVFLILDRKSGLVLFQGRVMDPRRESLGR
jgi:serpin B